MKFKLGSMFLVALIALGSVDIYVRRVRNSSIHA